MAEGVCNESKSLSLAVMVLRTAVLSTTIPYQVIDGEKEQYKDEIKELSSKVLEAQIHIRDAISGDEIAKLLVDAMTRSFNIVVAIRDIDFVRGLRSDHLRDIEQCRNN